MAAVKEKSKQQQALSTRSAVRVPNAVNLVQDYLTNESTDTSESLLCIRHRVRFRGCNANRRTSSLSLQRV